MPEGAARTLLAFDFGLKRIGVAVGEAELKSAHPLPAIAAGSTGCFAAIERLVGEWKPSGFVVGVPGGGPAHPMARRSERFARQLEGRYRLPVARVDESYSSLEAEDRLRGARRSKRAIDSVAAQILLEQFFNEPTA